MPTFVYRCPNTGLEVQGWIDEPAEGAAANQSVTCPACGGVHQVEAKTRKVVEDEGK